MEPRDNLLRLEDEAGDMFDVSHSSVNPFCIYVRVDCETRDAVLARPKVVQFRDWLTQWLDAHPEEAEEAKPQCPVTTCDCERGCLPAVLCACEVRALAP